MVGASGMRLPVASNGMSQKFDLDRAMMLLAIFTVGTGLVGLAAALSGKFDAVSVAIAGLLLTCTSALLLRLRRGTGIAPRWRDLACLLAVAICFRLPAYNYVLGGQDEGLYVNIANTIERTGGMDIRDNVGQELRGSAHIATYNRQNHSTYVLEGKTYPDYMNGIYLNGPDGKLEFQFYRLFPVWIAIFSGIAGQQYGVYALTFLSLVSIGFLYRLTLLLTSSRKAALTAGLLIAFSPLHAFFSKFPVTEVPALAFSAIGFTYLAAYWRAGQNERRKAWLVVSVVAMGCLFLTRISGFMYVPFILALAVAALVGDRDRQRSRALNGWAAAVAAAYGLSVLYGLFCSYHYSMDIYRLSFGPFFAGHWEIGSASLGLTCLVVWVAMAWVARGGRNERLRTRVIESARWAASVLLFVAVFFGAWRIYRFGWTDHFDTGPLKNLAHQGWRSAAASSLVQIMVYAGPMLLLFLAMGWRPKREPALECLRIFVIGFIVYVATLQWILPYGPYFARYLLSELIPYMILFVVVAWSRSTRGARRTALAAAIAATAVYSGATAAAQIGKRENVGLYESLQHLVQGIGPGDIILLESSNSAVPNTSELKTPLVYTFDKNVVAVDQAALANAKYLAALGRLYGRIFLITPQAQPTGDYHPVRSEHVDVWAFRPTHFWPRELVKRESMDLHVFELKALSAPSNSQ